MVCFSSAQMCPLPSAEEGVDPQDLAQGSAATLLLLKTLPSTTGHSQVVGRGRDRHQECKQQRLFDQDAAVAVNRVQGRDLTNLMNNI
jgi:hypothetical protein